jgi:hypothetical protein
MLFNLTISGYSYYMPRMQTGTETLTQRYTPIITRMLDAFGAHNRIFPLWLNPLLGRLIIRGHCRALNLLGKLAAGLYCLPRRRTAPRKPPTTTASQAAATQAPKKPRLPMAWKWLTRALPSPICDAARAAGAELQQLLSEPETAEIFAAAPALRTHLRPLCRALGVALPAEPLPADAHGPEPDPPPAVVRPLPEPGWTIEGRTLTPAESRAIDWVANNPGPRIRLDPRYCLIPMKPDWP